ncbi:Uncharacterized protein APZ42_012820 [Daphnia magna]|uniref:Uncharacterized protein n=1 Tax=Daphnia magna TaxID=35525 RepID=A0A162REF0_9CRUS|nr:Uncharacterized protein APZ42_012820 [Daphnia magna]
MLRHGKVPTGGIQTHRFYKQESGNERDHATFPTTLSKRMDQYRRPCH